MAQVWYGGEGSTSWGGGAVMADDEADSTGSG